MPGEARKAAQEAGFSEFKEKWQKRSNPTKTHFERLKVRQRFKLRGHCGRWDLCEVAAFSGSGEAAGSGYSGDRGVGPALQLSSAREADTGTVSQGQRGKGRGQSGVLFILIYQSDWGDIGQQEHIGFRYVWVSMF